MAKITNQFISKCEKQVLEQEKTFWDEELRGFGVRIRPSGRKVFIVQYQNELGRARKFTLGTLGVLTPQEARTKAKIILGRVAAGEDPAAEREKSRTAKTIAELCDEHLLFAKGRIKESTWEMDKSRIECHVKPLIGSRAVKSMMPSNVERFMHDVIAGKSARTGKKRGRGGRISGGPGVGARAVAMLGTVLERAVRDGTLPRNPVHGIARPKQVPKRPRFTFELVEKLGEALRTGYEFDLSRNGLDSIRLLPLTGRRRQEILGLRWEEVEFKAQCLRLADTKSGPQTRPIGNAALDVIRDRDRSTKYVFPADSPTGHYVGLPKIWAAVARRAGLTPMTIHGMRHWFASVVFAPMHRE